MQQDILEVKDCRRYCFQKDITYREAVREESVAFKSAESWRLKYLPVHCHWGQECLILLCLQKHMQIETPPHTHLNPYILEGGGLCNTCGERGRKQAASAETSAFGKASVRNRFNPSLWGTAASSPAFELCTRPASWPGIISISPASIFKGSGEKQGASHAHVHIKRAPVLRGEV